ncbi:hypothetical protein DFR24_1714 [Panacagrimonas perspica]|uniref:Uncharacterized protein n=1 Tax=Panacagrimonas perspica TaxID=381431 RepID=A0A4S3KAP9_9GAMM|nr:hypothetical protein [Panacagrimonas perspica]TDU32320.1 hypothetical protein DFR24_1714 [Panacagrimonas perspica]THD05258.1 hypothetical protein B1810_00455 [Panacagrimonas perspica]
MRALLAVLLLASSTALQAHGGVSMEDDHCIMRIGPYRAHFTGYQPETRATQEFCEDIPELGKAIIVVDFVDKVLREQKVEFRVLRDTRQLGRKARHEDLGTPAEIDAATLFKADAQAYPKGTLTFEQRYEQPGWFIGMLSATDADGKTLHSVFPFQVGVSHPWRYVPAFVLVVVLSLLIYRLTGRNLPSPTPGKSDT